jgi:hypothetical protein
MVKVKNSLVGQKFGMLTVIEQDEDYVNPSGKHYAKYLCQCDCGNEVPVSVTAYMLTSGRTRSCGCLRKTLPSKMFKKENKKDLSGEYGIIWATNKNEKIYFDLEDAEKVLSYSWGVDSQGYATATIDGKKVKMHAFLGYPNYDHHNRNKLDNRKTNLVKCTTSENNLNKSKQSNNTSGFIGVSWHKQFAKWRARVSVNKKEIHLGLFDNIQDAVVARLIAEKKYYGDFAPQRHLFDEYGIT